MPIIIMSKPASKLEPSLKKKAYAFLEKLGEDDTSPGLHIEPIAHSADDKVRTGRVGGLSSGRRPAAPRYRNSFR